jgi:DHA1 family 2-module integral membrane pump EmrD-like MFS transporter
MVVSILFILPIPAAFFGAWFGRTGCLADDVDPGAVWRDDRLDAALFFFGAGMLFPLATSGAMEPFPFLAGTAGALVGGLQNIGSGALAWLSAMMPQTGQASLGLLMTLMGLLILLCWLPLASRVPHHEQPV